LVRALLLHALKDALARDSQRTDTGGSPKRSRHSGWLDAAAGLGLAAFTGAALSFGGALAARSVPAAGFAENAQANFDVGSAAAVARVDGGRPAVDLLAKPLGAARAQLHETYIVSQTRDGLVSSISMRRMSDSFTSA